MGDAEAEADAARPDGAIGAVANAFDLLAILARDGEIRVNRASRELGLSRSTVHRLLATMLAYEYVEQDATTKAYRRGTALRGIESPSVGTAAEPTAAVAPSTGARGETRPIDELIFEIFRVNDRLLALGDATVQEFGLTSSRWLVLGAIAISLAPLTVAQVARRMGLSRQAVQRIANEMSSTGLIEFRDNPGDRRARLIALTGRGRATYAAALGRWREDWTAAMEAAFPDDEIVATARALRRLRAFVESRPWGRPAAG